MKNVIGLIIAILLLGYGLIRIGVGTSLLLQSLDLIHFSDLAGGVSDVKVFIDARANQQIFPFSLSGYFGYILMMGLWLVVGAIGAIGCYRWGYYLLGLYLAMHAALFINFQEINPKIIGLGLQLLLLCVLYYLRPPSSKIAVLDDNIGRP